MHTQNTSKLTSIYSWFPSKRKRGREERKEEGREGRVGRWEGGRIMSTNRGKCDIMEKIQSCASKALNSSCSSTTACTHILRYS